MSSELQSALVVLVLALVQYLNAERLKRHSSRQARALYREVKRSGNGHSDHEIRR